MDMFCHNIDFFTELSVKKEDSILKGILSQTSNYCVGWSSLDAVVCTLHFTTFLKYHHLTEVSANGQHPQASCQAISQS